VCAELSKLQDQMPPFSTAEAHAVIEAELGAPVEDLFQSFSATPVAAASLGQVYRGRLWPHAHVAPTGSAWASTAQHSSRGHSSQSTSHASSGSSSSGSGGASAAGTSKGDFEELGLEVAVKVQRPGLGPTVLLDAHVLRNTAKLLQATVRLL
jgi:predicted unusual protein kinase regulating ubiquinone biosynthesis (AarF/ABC1/UbiB family)